jgi:hypothetical protein
VGGWGERRASDARKELTHRIQEAAVEVFLIPE